jgi:hypothetical protein
MSIDVRRLAVFIALMLLGVAVQVRSVEWLGWHVDIVLPILVIAACWITLLEETLLVLIAVLLLNWRPGFSWEMVIFALVPLSISAFGPYIPWRRTVSILGGTLLGIIIMYAVSGGGSAFAWHGFLWKDVVVSTLAAFVLSRMVRSVYGLQGRKSRGVFYELPR